jgi:hypothetical protein
MGHTLTEWSTRVGELLRDETGKDVSTAQVQSTGLRPAFAQYSSDRPRTIVTEAAGTGSPYLAVPAGWMADVSSLEQVEHPARQNPPALLDSQSWAIVRDPADVTVTKILLLNRTPTVTEYVRLTFTGAWPFPTGVAGDDLVDDMAFEAVCNLAASHACIALAGQAARARAGALPTDFVDGRDRSRLLLEAAKRYRGVYEAYLGLASCSAGGGDQGGSAAPAHGRYDFDPGRGSMFHGGRR